MDSWDYEENLDQLDYQPQKNRWLEIWQYEVGIHSDEYLDLGANWSTRSRVLEVLIFRKALLKVVTVED